jgi:hypothetical protein
MNNETFDKFPLFFNKELKIIQVLYDNIEDFSLTSYYFLFKGLQYEFGLFKKINIDYAMEFYKTGGFSYNSFCFYRLYINYSKLANQDLSLFYLLKFISYYDKESFLNYLIPDMDKFKQILHDNYDNLKTLINSNNEHFILQQKEIDFLNICLKKICDSQTEERFDYLLELYKRSQHEEALYHIFLHLIKTEQKSNIEMLVNEKFLFNSNLKIYPLIINYSGMLSLHSDCPELATTLEENLSEVCRRVKIGGYYALYCDLLSMNTEITENKIKKNLRRAFCSGDIKSIFTLFHLNEFLNTHLDLEDDTFDIIFDFLQKNSSIYSGEMYIQSNILLAIFHIKGLRIVKNILIGIEILENLFNEKLHNEKLPNDSFLELTLIILYLLIKCYQKTFLHSQVEKYKKIFFEKLLSLDFTKSNIYLDYLIGKLLLNQKSIKESYDVLNSAQNKFPKYNESVYRIYFEFNSMSHNSPCLMDKIFLIKIQNLLKKRKEYELYLPRESIKLLTSVKNTNFCPNCKQREKEVLAVPCGHKFICLQCYEANETILFENSLINCVKCDTSIVAALKKVFN